MSGKSRHVVLKDVTALTTFLMGVPANARIVTDVGRSLGSGWGDLKAATVYAPDEKDPCIIELEFD